MKRDIRLIVVSLGLVASLSACGFVGQQLADKAREEQLLKPGALDPAIPTMPYYVKHTFKFLNKYQITHDWHNLGRSCGYSSYSGNPANIGLRVFDSKGEIFEENGKIYYRADKNYAGINKNTGDYWRSDFDRFVRPTYKRQIPEFGPGGIKTGRMLDKEEVGLEPVCFEAWVGTSHTLILRLHKRDLTTWKALWSGYNPSGKWEQKIVNGIHWWALENAEENLQTTGTGGWFQSWITPLGNTGYSLAIQLGANKQSLQHPQAHANFQAMFRHLIESVRVEEIKP